MRELTQCRAIGLLGLGLLTLVSCGCGGANRSELDIVPGADQARAALEKALTAWKNGEKCGKVQGDSQNIEVVDKVWKAGGKLAAFEILRAEDKPGPRWFTVKLTLVGSAEPQEVAYAVLGLDPLWVFRDEDFKKLSGM